jgi:tetratricopeptide (TPR) repeat protein
METLTAASLEAVHEYAQGMNFLSSGKPEEARQSFSKAVDLDQNFGLAYAGLAVASRNLGRRRDAVNYVKLAVSHIDRMTERERYRTRGTYYIQIDDHQKCVDEFSALVARYPADSMAHNNLALCATFLRNMPKAVEEMRRALEILPSHAMFRNNLGLYLSYGGDFQAGEKDARAAQQLNPLYVKAYVALAFAQLGQGQFSQAADTYRALEKVKASGAASWAVAGLGDLALYEGRFSEAAKIFEEGAAADVASKNPDRAAAKFVMLAYAQLLRGQKGPALAAAESALANSQTAKIRFLAARVLVAADEAARARKLAASLGSELAPEPQAYAKLIEGDALLKEGNAGQAVKAFTEANALLDTWLGRFDLGRAYLEAGAFPQADSEFDRCLKRRGEALALFWMKCLLTATCRRSTITWDAPGKG